MVISTLRWVAQRKLDTRVAMFGRGAEAVERVLVARFPELAGQYLCPICLANFPEEAVRGAAPELRLEHAPPKSMKLQREPVALTCAPCNEGAHQNEAHLAEYGRKLSFMRTRRLARRSLVISKGGVPIRGLIEVDGAKGQFMIPAEQNDPEQIRRFNEASPGPEGMRWEIPFRYEGDLVEHAYLKAAYVGAFARFGYRYTFGVRAARQVRDEVMDPQGRLRGFVGRWTDLHEATLRFVVCPRPLPTLMAEIGEHTIALPWFRSSPDYYSELASIMQEADGPVNFSYSTIVDWPKTLVMSEDFSQPPLPAEAWAQGPDQS